MKNFHSVIFLAVLSCSCSTYHYSHRSVNVDKSNLVATPVVVDLSVTDGKRIKASSDYRKSAESAKDQAYYRAISENRIDVVVDPVYKITYKPTFLFFRKRYVAEISGLGGKYTNSRNIHEVVKSYNIDTNSIKAFRKLNALNEKTPAVTPTGGGGLLSGLKFIPTLNLASLSALTSRLPGTIKILNFGPAAPVLSSKPVVRNMVQNLSFGVSAGFTSARIKSSESSSDAEAKIGVTGGVFLNGGIGKRSAFQTGLFYTQRGGKETFFDGGFSRNATYTLNYLEIPFNLLFYTKSGRSGLFFGGGPLVGIGLGGNFKAEFSDGFDTFTNEGDIEFGGDDNLKRTEFGFNLVAGIRSKKGRSLAVNYFTGNNIAPQGGEFSNRYIGLRFGYEIPYRIK